MSMTGLARWLLLLCFLAPAALRAEDASIAADQLVVLVRHAEKKLDGSDDPGLTAVGKARAKSLAMLLTDMHIGAILTTEWRRTRQTAQPLAKTLALTPQVINTLALDAEAHAKAFAEAVRAQPAAAVLVVGHSNTVPLIVAALGGPKLTAIADDRYDHLFLLWRHRGEVRFLHTQY